MLLLLQGIDQKPILRGRHIEDPLAKGLQPMLFVSEQKGPY